MTTTASTNGVGGLEWHDLSSQVRPRRRYEGAVPPPADEAAEGHLRSLLARKVADVLGQRPEAARGLTAFSVFTPAEIATVETLIDEEVTGYQLEQTGLGLPGLQDPEGARRRLRAGLSGMAQLQGPFDDPDVEDICVDSYSTVDVVVDGQFFVAEGVYFASEADLRQFAVRLVESSGGRLDEAEPLAEVELLDGSRLAASLPPISPGGTCLTIRKFRLRNRSVEDLQDLGAVSQNEADFLGACVHGGIGVVFSGRTGAGKSTFLNAFGALLRLDPGARVAVLQDVPELDLPHTLPSVVHHRTRGKNVEGKGEVTLNDLVKHALRERPTHLIIGEMRGKEAHEVLKSLSSGHAGLSTVHAREPLDALERLVELAREADSGATSDDIRQLIARQIRVVVQLGHHWAVGRRQILSIYELEGIRDGGFSGHTLWEAAPDGVPVMRNMPSCLELLGAQGISYSPPQVGARG
jgi:pilus assembly protein CpaF